MEPEADRRSFARRCADLALIALFAVAVLAPTVDLFVRDDVARGPGPELRRPAPKPALPSDLRELIAFPRQYEAYWKDSFGLRDKLLRSHSAFKVLALGVSPDPLHVIGKERWIYNTNDHLIDSWRGARPLSDERLAAWVARLERRRRAVEELGAHYVFALAPDKPSIYPEYVPDRLNKFGPSAADQFYEYARAHSTVDVLDLRPALIAEKVNDAPGDYVYYRLGTHWQLRGAIAGYNAFVERLRPLFPSLPTLPLSEHRLLEYKNLGDAETRNMYIPDLIPQQDHFYTLKSGIKHKTLQPRRDGSRTLVTANPGADLPRVVILHDSFGPFFENQWAAATSHLAMIHDYEFDLVQIASHQPDIVIELIVERMLHGQDPSKLTAGEQRTVARRFANAAKVLYALEPAAPALKPLRRAEVKSASDERGAHVELQARIKGSVFELQGLTPQPAAQVLARVVIDAQEAGSVALLWRCEGDAGWLERRKAQMRTAVGRNELHLLLQPGDKPLERVLLVAQPRPGAWRLRELELRVEAQP